MVDILQFLLLAWLIGYVVFFIGAKMAGGVYITDNAVSSELVFSSRFLPFLRKVKSVDEDWDRTLDVDAPKYHVVRGDDGYYYIESTYYRSWFFFFTKRYRVREAKQVELDGWSPYRFSGYEAARENVLKTFPLAGYENTLLIEGQGFQPALFNERGSRVLLEKASDAPQVKMLPYFKKSSR